MPRVVFTINENIKDRVKFVTNEDKRSIQKEIEYLFEKRFNEISIDFEIRGKQVLSTQPK